MPAGLQVKHAHLRRHKLSREPPRVHERFIAPIWKRQHFSPDDESVPKTGKKSGHEPAHLALRGTAWHKSAPYI